MLQYIKKSMVYATENYFVIRETKYHFGNSKRNIVSKLLTNYFPKSAVFKTMFLTNFL